MNWAQILQTDSGPCLPLPQRIDTLLTQQRQSWLAYRAGEAALDELQTKTLVSDGDSVTVQLNAARRPSILANTDPQSVAARPCFLCPENMPPEERGVVFEDLVVLPNPFPILPQHFTISSREHRPQQIGGRVDQFLRIAHELGPELAALYNGPRCGASAPDHFHFQCAQSERLPILNQLPPAPAVESILPHASFGRRMLVLRSPDAERARVEIQQAIAALATPSPHEEPLLNLVAHFDGSHFTTILFPRAMHRPRAYFAPEPERIAISPGIMEMCGVIVVTNQSDFERIDSTVARAIYEEVTVDTSLRRWN